MKVTYDPIADAATIYFVPRTPGMSKKTEMVEVDGHMLAIDFDAAGRLIYIEVLNATKVLPAELLKSASRPGSQP
jgi:uncharacterized protein YuzE